MVQREVTPAAVAFRQGRIRRTEVGHGNLNCGGARLALGCATSALNLVTSAASKASVEDSGACGNRVGAIASAVQISVATCTSYKPNWQDR